MRDQTVPGHNRWHPDIPPATTVAPAASGPARVDPGSGVPRSSF